jgi:DNA-binding NarL/FixJ family response regulator
MPTNIAIVEDDAEVCADLEKMLGETTDLVCVCTCRNAHAALRKIPKCIPDIVIMDIQLPDMSGIECTARLKRLVPGTHIMMFTIQEDEEQIFRALKAGASGYLLKGTEPSALFNALREIMSGGAPLSRDVARKLVQSFHEDEPEEGMTDPLTPREKEVLEFLAEGHISKEIADRLFINIETVNYHLKQIYQKMNVHSRTEAVVKYLKRQRFIR